VKLLQKLFLKTESVQHGDVFFFLNDATAGTQSSHTKVLERNQPTINVDTLQNGWQEITIDISSYTRSQINMMGFYISSQDGWDTSKGFDLNLDSLVFVKFWLGNISIDNNLLYFIAGLMLFGLTIFLGWRAFAKKKKQTAIIFIFLLAPIIIAFISSFFVPTIAPKRLLLVLPQFYFLLALGITSLSKKFQKPINNGSIGQVEGRPKDMLHIINHFLIGHRPLDPFTDDIAD